MEKKIKVSVLTLGCRVNQYESDAIMQSFAKKGVTVCENDDICDIYVINTCSVTAESDRKSRQFIRRCISKNPDAVIVVTGCYSQINPDAVSAIEGVDFVCGNNGKSAIVEKSLELLKEKKTVFSYMPDIYDGHFDSMSVGKPMTRTRAFVKIEDGCESKCAYCIIPYARGSVRSESPEVIKKEVENIVYEGCREVVLTGIETASYGKDLENTSLSDLLCEINKTQGLKRIRLGSLDPAAVGKDFADKVSSLDKVMPHFHISLQSGCTKTLNRMRRKYNILTAEKNIEYLQSKIPDLMLSADIITGFPGESDDDFEETLDFFRRHRFLRVHIFPYSKRKGTPAAIMDNQVDESVKRVRLHKLEALEKEVRTSLLKDFVSSHKEAEVLFESYDGEFALGHTPNFIEVKAKSNKPLDGEFITVKPIFSDSEYVYAEI